jgi:hypothetical protein
MISVGYNLLSREPTAPFRIDPIDFGERHPKQFSSSAHREAIVNFYDRWLLPPILDLVMRQNQLEKYRREVVAAAGGRVVGVGSGLNFQLYGKQVEIILASSHRLARACWHTDCRSRWRL